MGAGASDAGGTGDEGSGPPADTTATVMPFEAPAADTTDPTNTDTAPAPQTTTTTTTAAPFSAGTTSPPRGSPHTSPRQPPARPPPQAAAATAAASDATSSSDEDEDEKKPPPKRGNTQGPSSTNAAAAKNATADATQRKRVLNGPSIEYKYPSGSVYTGGFKDGKLHGYGKYRYHPSGDVYEGEWLSDMKHGQGTYTYDGGDKYTGEWRVGKKHGKGTYVFSSGDEYVGAWKDDKIHGFGVFTIARNGNRYEGHWEDSYRHGHGVLRSGGGDVYDGQWVRGKEEGLGIIVHSNGKVYAGDWRIGQQDGKGIVLEQGQKHVVEHIAGYMISKVPVDMDALVEQEWNAANRLFEQYRKKGMVKDATETPAGMVPQHQHLKSVMDVEMWKKRYEDLAERRAAEATDDSAASANDVASLKEKIAALTATVGIATLKADDAKRSEKLLQTEVEEHKAAAAALQRRLEVHGGPSEDEMIALRHRIEQLEAELKVRSAAPKSAEIPVEVAVKLELAEVELRQMKSLKEELAKVRSKEAEGTAEIQRLESRNEELNKELSLNRARATNLMGQISESKSKATSEATEEASQLRDELKATQTQLHQLEEQMRRAKRQYDVINDRAKVADQLEQEVARLRMSRTAAADTEMGKNLERKSEQLDSLRRQNAELQRQVEEISHDLQMKETAKPLKVKKGRHDEGDGAAHAPDADALQADLKKEKKRHKKAASERDSLAVELFQEQVRLVRAMRHIDCHQGRINVVARVRTQGGGKAVVINPDDPTQVTVVSPSGAATNYAFDAAVSDETPIDEAYAEIRGPLPSVVQGFHVAVLFTGPLGSGKTYTATQLLPLFLQDLDELAGAAASVESLQVQWDVSVIAARHDGVFDASTGSQILQLMHNDTANVVALGGGLSKCDSAQAAIQRISTLTSAQRSGGRCHTCIKVFVTLRNTVNDTYRRGTLTLFELGGVGSLSDQANVEAGKFVNQSNASVAALIDSLGARQYGTSYDSHTTQLLADVLGGNGQTTVVVCVSGADSSVNDTTVALAVAQKAKNVLNQPLVQHLRTAEVVRLRGIVADLGGADMAASQLKPLEK